MDDTSRADAPPKANKAAPAEAPKAEKAPTNWVIPVGTALVLISLFCIYYFVYVRAQREYLTNRNFRTLATLGDQLQMMISTHGSILEFYFDQATGRHGRQKRDLEQLAIVRPEDKDLPTAEKKKEAYKDYLKYLAPALTWIPTEKQLIASMAQPRLEVQRRNGRWELLLTTRPDDQHKPPYFKGSLPLDDLLNPLVGSLPFDDILLVSEAGTIIYQSKKNGAQFTTLTALLQAQAGSANGKPPDKTTDDEQESQGTSKTGDDLKNGRRTPILRNSDRAWRKQPTHSTDIVLASTRYKLFMQSVLVDSFSDDPTQDEPAREWVLCGLTRSSALEWEALSISSTFIVWFTALFLAVWMSVPLLKIAFLNQRERLRLRELGFLGLFLVLLTSVFTLSGLQAVYVYRNDDTEARLKHLGESLARSISEELGGMRDQLKRWCDSDALHQDLELVQSEKNEVVKNRSALSKTSSQILYPYIYPYVNNAFWTDDDGQQIVKWGAGGYVTPMIDASALPAYLHAKTTFLNAQPPPFHFDSLLPPNKLEYLANVSMKTQDCNPALDRPVDGHPPIHGDLTAGFAFLTAQPLSLIDPILPLDYGFAVVDETGLVLFHSDKIKNRRENFLQETDWNKELYSAMFGHSTGRSLSIKYLGTDYRARVFAIPGVFQPHWSLIVYRDLTSVRTIDLQVMTMGSTLFLSILALPVLVFAIWAVIRRPQSAPEWMWPNEARMGTYLYQIFLYLLLIVLFLFLGFGGSSEQSVTACAVVPYSALLLTWWCFRSYPSAGGQTPDQNSRTLFSAPALISILSAVALVLLLAIQGFFLAVTLLLVFGIMAAIPLMDPLRHYLNDRFNHWYAARAIAQEHSGRSPQGLFTYRNCYVLSSLLLILLLGVLTPMALFRASLRVERRLGLKRAQLYLASALERRFLATKTKCDDVGLRDVGCEQFEQPNSAAWRKLVFDPLFPPKIDPVVDSSPGYKKHEFYSAWFQTLIYKLHHDYNLLAAEALGVISDRSDSQSPDPAWSWNDQASTITLHWHGVQPPASKTQAASENVSPEKDLSIQAAVPAPPRTDVLAGITVAVSVLLAIGLLFSALARKLFLFNVAPRKMTGSRQASESVHEGRNIVVLLPPEPKSDWKLDQPGSLVDLAVLSATELAEALNPDNVPLDKIIEIRHYEQIAGNDEIENQTSKLLRRLREANVQLAVVMNVPVSSTDYRSKFPDFEVIDLREEPFHWLEKYAGPARDLLWKECGPLAALWPIGAQLAKDINRDLEKEPIHSADSVASEILERADGYYRLVWRDCSKEQKFVLAQLAEDGLPNPTNGRAIWQLMRRGLIVKDPQFRIMNESFRRFLLSAATTRLKREWLNEARLSGWGKLHGAFFTTMIILGIFLLTTQNALWQSSAAYVTTALGALGTLAKMFSTFRGGGTDAQKN